jgi:type II secretory pathway component PulF
MPDYNYKAADANGALVRGVRFAHDAQELAVQLRMAGLALLEYRITKTNRLLDLFDKIEELGGFKRRELIEFSNNMGTMIRAGVPLVRGLDEIREDTENKFFKKILSEIIADIEAGDTLSEAMSKRPKVFPSLYVNVVEIGESTGRLDSVFFDLARHYKRIDDLIRNVRKAMIYPAFVIVALLVAAFVFLTVVFPPLFQLLVEFEVPLPMITKVVMGVSNFIRTNLFLILGGIAVFIILFIVLRRNDKTKYYIDWGELNFPFLKKLFILLRISFFMRYLSMMLSAGMEILRSLELSILSINNLVIQKMLMAAREQVIEGEFLSDSLRRIRYIPHMVTRMIAIGEEAGNLPDQMEYVADHYNEELERRITAALALLEPILLVLLAALALALVLGVLLPLYNLVSELSTGAGAGAGI